MSDTLINRFRGRLSALIMLAAALWLCVPRVSASDEAADLSPKREMRGAWLATVYNIDWPSQKGAAPDIVRAQKKELCRILDTLQYAGVNAVFFQVRPMADALYKSEREPWSAFLTGTRGTRPGWDPLRFAVDEAHARGMELHAWVNPFRFALSEPKASTPHDRRAIEKGWLVSHRETTAAPAKKTAPARKSRKSKKRRGRGGGVAKAGQQIARQLASKVVTVFDPGNDEAVGHVVDVCRDIIKSYDVDGLVFDDYFYPEGMPLPKSDNSEKEADARRHNVNAAIAAVHRMIQREKPWVRFGVAPAGVGGGNGKATVRYGLEAPPVGKDWMYDKIYCDPLAWLSEGTVDYVSPQIYWTTDNATNPYEPIAQWWDYVARHFGRHCFPSHSLTNRASTPAQWVEQGRQIDADRESEVPGTVLYSVSSVNGRKASGIAGYLHAHQYRLPALTPPMPWKKTHDPGKITGLKLRHDDDGARLTWASQPNMRYVVYVVPDDVSALDALAPDGNNFAPEYIAGVTYTPEFPLTDTRARGHWYAVAPFDRCSNEYPVTILNR